MILKLSLLAGAVAGEKTQVPVFGPKTKWGEPVFPFMDDWFSGGGTETGIPLGRLDFIQSRKQNKNIST